MACLRHTKGAGLTTTTEKCSQINGQLRICCRCDESMRANRMRPSGLSLVSLAIAWQFVGTNRPSSAFVFPTCAQPKRLGCQESLSGCPRPRNAKSFRLAESPTTRGGSQSRNGPLNTLTRFKSFANKNFFLLGMVMAVSLAKAFPSVSSTNRVEIKKEMDALSSPFSSSFGLIQP